MRILVTGGAGFIGGNLCRHLVTSALAPEVNVLDDFSSGREANLAGLNVKVFPGSILDEGALSAAIAGCDSVIHLAAVPSVPRSLKDPQRSHDVNASGTLRVLEAARLAGSPHIVVASSSSVYGSNPALPKSEDLRCAPVSPYAVSKLCAESYALAYGVCYGMRVLPFRFFNVFGPLQPAGHAYAAVVPAFIEAALSNRPLPMNGDGEQSRDFTFVDTVASVLADAALRQVTSGEPVNLAFGTRVTLAELVTIVERVLDKRLEIDYRPERPGDVRHSQADDRRLRALFPSLSPVDLTTGIEKTVAWFRDQAQLAHD